MASSMCSPGLTLTPFKQMYGDVHGGVLLTDDFFATPERRIYSATCAEPDALMPQVITLPNRARFEAAVAQWLEDIELDSLPDEMKNYDSFRAILQDGMSAVPLIAAHLRRSPSFLFLALEELFGEDPIPEEAYGNLKTTVSAWLKWLQR